MHNFAWQHPSHCQGSFRFSYCSNPALQLSILKTGHPKATYKEALLLYGNNAMHALQLQECQKVTDRLPAITCMLDVVAYQFNHKQKWIKPIHKAADNGRHAEKVKSMRFCCDGKLIAILSNKVTLILINLTNRNKMKNNYLSSRSSLSQKGLLTKSLLLIPDVALTSTVS